MSALDDGELVDGQPVVVPGVIEVDHPRLVPSDRAILRTVLDGHAIDEHPVERTVAGLERRALRTGELANRVLSRLVWKIRVEPVDRLGQPLFEYDLVVAVALGARSVGSDVFAVLNTPAEPLQPLEGDVFDFVLGEGGHYRRLLSIIY